MKSPEDIAAEVAEDYFDTYDKSEEPIVETWQELVEAIVAAIKADRRQRDESSLVYVDSPYIQGLLDRYHEAREGDSNDAEHEVAAEMAELLQSIHDETILD